MLNCRFYLFCFVLSFSSITGQTNQGQSKLALVIGNSNYNAGFLSNPVNDAHLMASTLDSLDFDVILDTNLSTKSDFQSLIREFGRRRPLYDIAFIYYAGHGIQIGNENYLLPTKEEFQSEFDVEDYGVSVQSILRYLNNATDKVNILILDACRNNPFESKWVKTRSLNGNGLAEMPPPNGSLIAFSTDAGYTAADGNEENSIYTSSLASNLLKPNVEITQVFKNVRTEVLLKTMNQQSPVENSKLTGGELYLNYQEDKLVVSLEKELVDTFHQFDSLALLIKNKSSVKGIIEKGDEDTYSSAAKLFSAFSSLSEKLEIVDESLYQLALLGMLKTGILASSNKNGEFSSNYHLEAGYRAASKLYAELEKQESELSDLLLKRVKSKTQFYHQMGIGYLMYASISDNITVKNDSNLIKVIEFLDKSFATFDYTTKLIYLHLFQQLVVTDHVDVSKLHFLVRKRNRYLLNSLTDLTDAQNSLLFGFFAYQYVEDKSKTIRVDNSTSFDTEVGLFVISELRSKLAWAQNFGALVTHETFQDFISKYPLNDHLRLALLDEIHFVTQLLELAWNESEEIDLLYDVHNELQLLIDVLTNHITVINYYSFELDEIAINSDRFKLTEFKIEAYEAFKQLFQHPQYEDYQSVKEYDYLILREKLNCYANGTVLKEQFPEDYLGIQEKSLVYFQDVRHWFNNIFSATERIDTLDKRILTSYLYFVQRYALFESQSDQEVRGIYLDAARLVSRLGWSPSIYADFFSNSDVERFWKSVFKHATYILNDSTYQPFEDSNVTGESIELLQHYRKFYETRYSGTSSFTMRASWSILKVLELCYQKENIGLAASEWSELARSFCGLQEIRMRYGDDEEWGANNVSYIESDWNNILDFIESSLVLKKLDNEQYEIIIGTLYSEISQVQTFRTNSETEVFNQGLDKLIILKKP